MNLTRSLSFLKHTLLVAVVLLTIGISGCDNGDDGPTIFSGTVVDLMASNEFKQSVNNDPDKSLDSLVKYLTYYNLNATLSGPGPYTVFAPNNTAFINLLALPGFPQDIRNIDPAIVTGVLSYHVVPAKNLKASLTSGASFSTLFTGAANNPDDKIIVNSDGTLLTGSSNKSIQVTTYDKQATNGVVHVTATVLIPQTIGASLTPILGTVAGTVLLGKDFTNLAKIIKAADANFTESAANGAFKVSTWLAMPIATTGTATANIKGITFIAPPNAAGTTPVLTDAIVTAVTSQADKGRAFLLNHLITSGQYIVGELPASNPNGIVRFTNGTQITPKSGDTKKITVSVSAVTATNPTGVALSNATTPTADTFRPIVKKDIAHNNGMLQVFAGALQ
jgi:uncharacterized surface protein with fasciclin (FAS1) repeats